MSTPPIRYQVFVSSTYEDLRQERQQVTQAILEANSFPAGMELFPASDESQWELIKRVIEESDYYVVIVGGRYGSLGSTGRGYTEMEYDFAVDSGIPVLGFVIDNIDDLPSKHVESDPRSRKLLEDFRAKVMSRSCRKFANPSDLGLLVMKSLMHEVRVRPRTGWIRASEARSEEDRRREEQLRADLEDALNEIESLEREIRDRVILGKEISTDQLAQGSDKFSFEITYRDNQKKLICREVEISWDEIFEIIGPSLFGYVVRKAADVYNRNPKYPFEDNIERHLRRKVYRRCPK